MNDADMARRKLAERVLAKNDLPLALLLEHVVPVQRLRELVRKLGLSPKGGFRVERAPARVLAPLLAELKDAEQLEEVIALLLPQRAPDAALGEPSAPETAHAEAAAVENRPLLALRDAEIARLRAELDRARDNALRASEREAELSRRHDQAQQQVLLLRRDAERARPGPRAEVETHELRELVRRNHELESERQGFIDADEALRRQLAHNQSRLRMLELQLAELEALLPKGKRKRKPPVDDAAPAVERRLRLPYFLPSFYKSLEGRERRSIERAYQAILLFCTEGHAYPGLEVKQLGGQDTWSFRASLGLRVYFRPLPEGDIELLELGNREDQNTTLRRLKER
jgi:hypothetical protein